MRGTRPSSSLTCCQGTCRRRQLKGGIFGLPRLYFGLTSTDGRLNGCTSKTFCCHEKLFLYSSLRLPSAGG